MRKKNEHGRCVSAHMLGELTPTEKNVLILVGRGFKSQEVADILVISKRTVDFHLANIYDFFEVGNRTEAVEMAIQKGLINPEEILIEKISFDKKRKLTPTELKVAKLRTLHPTKVVADMLVVSKRTVDFHLLHIYEKMNIKNVMQLGAIVRLIRMKRDDSTTIGCQILKLYENVA